MDRSRRIPTSNPLFKKPGRLAMGLTLWFLTVKTSKSYVQYLSVRDRFQCARCTLADRCTYRFSRSKLIMVTPRADHRRSPLTATVTRLRRDGQRGRTTGRDGQRGGRGTANGDIARDGQRDGQRGDGGGNGPEGPPRRVAEGLPAPRGRESVRTRGLGRLEAAAEEPKESACRLWNGEERADRLRLRR